MIASPGRRTLSPLFTPSRPVRTCRDFCRRIWFHHSRTARPRLAPQAQPGQVLAARPLLVGVIHSLSGTLVNSEAPVVDATLLAIEEINQRGGIRGRKVEVLVRDGQSDGLTFCP